MPVTPTYPGVYIEEIPSGVRTITGVATSIAAFAGWAAKGPTDRAGSILSWSDFERQYGGLDPRSLLGYAVSHFFLNGGQRAYIVRLVAGNAATASVQLDTDLTLTARSPGAWANDYGVALKARTDPGYTDRFQLSVVYVQDGTEVTVESFANLSMDPADRRAVETVVNTESTIITAQVTAGAAAPPPDTTVPSPRLANGDDGTVLVPDAGDFETALMPSSPDGGLYHLDRIDLFNLLCVPGETKPAIVSTLQDFCRERRAFLIADSAQNATYASMEGGPDSNLTGDDSINAAFFFPWVNAPDPLQENRPRAFPPCGFVAGLYARTDASRGVWKAPAGTEASLSGVTGVTVPLTDKENGVLNPQAIDCIRTFPIYGTVIWGARTLQGHDERGSEWKYVPVRRMALFIEETLYRSLKWVVFEPNDEPLWSQIRLNVGAFMHGLFRQGAFQGSTPGEAYFVKCDSETTTQNDINMGIVNIVVGFAPLKPAEFVIIKIQQMAGQIEV
jgi:phage tail sheath protein FI